MRIALADYTADREFHPALKTSYSNVCIIISVPAENATYILTITSHTIKMYSDDIDKII